MHLVLASTSPYRAAILSRLQLPFSQADPLAEEEHLEGETPTEMCRRLAREKAWSVINKPLPTPALVIGSDQVAHLDGRIFGKPGEFSKAFEQLTACSGRWVTFETAICLLSSDGYEALDSESFQIRFRDLDENQITRYLNVDEPWDCAGSIRAEGYGIILVSESHGRDVNTLLGLPLMMLTDMLAAAGYNLPG